MVKVLLKFVGGIALGLVLFFILKDARILTGSQWLICVLWGIGIAGSIKTYISLITGALMTSLKTGIFSVFAFGSGFLGIVILPVLLGFALALGWIYGWILLIREFIAVITA